MHPGARRGLDPWQRRVGSLPGAVPDRRAAWTSLWSRDGRGPGSFKKHLKQELALSLPHGSVAEPGCWMLRRCFLLFVPPEREPAKPWGVTCVQLVVTMCLVSSLLWAGFRRQSQPALVWLSLGDRGCVTGRDRGLSSERCPRPWRGERGAPGRSPVPASLSAATLPARLSPRCAEEGTGLGEVAELTKIMALRNVGFESQASGFSTL